MLDATLENWELGCRSPKTWSASRLTCSKGTSLLFRQLLTLSPLTIVSFVTGWVTSDQFRSPIGFSNDPLTTEKRKSNGGLA